MDPEQDQPADPTSSEETSSSASTDPAPVCSPDENESSQQTSSDPASSSAPASADAAPVCSPDTLDAAGQDADANAGTGNVSDTSSTCSGNEPDPIDQTAEMSVHVQADDGTPIQGVNVTVAGTPLAGVTDATGNYDFGQIAPGTYTVNGVRADFGPTPASQTQNVAASQSAQVTLTMNPIKVDLTIQNATLTLKHNNQTKIEITVLPAGTTVDAYKIEIRGASSAAWCTLGTTATLDPFKAKIAGTFKVRGTATINGVDKLTPEKDLIIQFPAYSDITGDAGVSSQVGSAWTATLNDCTAAPNQRREQGFWIRLNTQTDTYEFTATVFGAWSGPTSGAGVNLPPRPADSSATPTPCDPGATYSVASFHTHTSTEFRNIPANAGTVRPIGPSGADNGADTTDGVPGVVYDFVESPAGSGSIPMGHPKTSAAQLYLSLGLNRRATPP